MEILNNNFKIIEQSQFLCKCALKGSARHNVDISKQLSDAMKLMNLEKYVY
jgi:hypothetical protein